MIIHSRASMKREYAASLIVLAISFIISISCLIFSVYIWKRSLFYAVSCILAGSMLSFIIRYVFAPNFYSKKKEYENIKMEENKSKSLIE
jgi:hypothetical protein